MAFQLLAIASIALVALNLFFPDGVLWPSLIIINYKISSNPSLGQPS